MSLIDDPVREIAPTIQAPETTLFPEMPIIDSHHHLYDRPQNRYLAPDYLADITTGHNVQGSVFVQARAFYRDYGSELFRPVGETEYAADVAEQHGSGSGPQLCVGIVGFADLMAGDGVRPVLEAHILAGKGRFRGIRHILAWSKDKSLLNPAYPTTEDMTTSPEFLKGFSHLAKLGLGFDAWLLFPQLPRLVTLARLFPETQFILNHCGGVLRVGVHANELTETYRQWRSAMMEVATCPNVSVKVGGLGMALSGFGFQHSDTGPASTQLADAWKPWVLSCFELFGTERCMFGSNFPADRPSYGMHAGLNASKRLSAELTETERHAFFYGNALRTYHLALK